MCVVVIVVAISGDKFDQDRSQNIFKYEDLTRKSKSKSDISNNRGNSNQLKIIQTVPKQRTGKAGNQGTTKKK